MKREGERDKEDRGRLVVGKRNRGGEGVRG